MPPVGAAPWGGWLCKEQTELHSVPCLPTTSTGRERGTCTPNAAQYFENIIKQKPRKSGQVMVKRSWIHGEAALQTTLLLILVTMQAL